MIVKYLSLTNRSVKKPFWVLFLIQFMTDRSTENNNAYVAQNQTTI